MKKGVLLTAVILFCFTASLFATGSQDSAAGGNSIEEREKLVWLISANANNQTALEAVVAAFEEKYPVDIEFEFKPQADEGDNLVKTRLATNDMPDLLSYNSGSLFKVLNLEKNFVDLSDQPLADKLVDSFKTVVSSGSGFYGIPGEPIPAGGILYNKKVYAELGLSIPRTWDDFLKNCEKIKASGKIAVIASYKTNWTAQLLLLADYFNVQSMDPQFADDYTKNKAKFATTPSALRGFEKIQEVYIRGFINEESTSTTYDMAQEMLASGEGAHFPMATWALAAINEKFPDKIDDIGFFPVPGDNAESNGLTLWMPNNISIPKSSEHVDAALQFANFFVSDEGLAAYLSAGVPNGMLAIKGVELPDTIFPAVKDALVYIDANKTAPALEFLSPIKGPNLPQICVQAGLALKTPLECAQEYDRDVEKQAKQLMLPNW